MTKRRQHRQQSEKSGKLVAYTKKPLMLPATPKAERQSAYIVLPKQVFIRNGKQMSDEQISQTEIQVLARVGDVIVLIPLGDPQFEAKQAFYNKLMMMDITELEIEE